MLLHSVLSALAAERELAASTLYQYRHAIDCYSRQLGHAATTADLTEDSVNSWLCVIDRAPRTVANYRRGLLVVWNYAAERGWSSYYNPRRVRRIRVPQPLPRPFTRSEVSAILSACDDLSGRTRCGVPASLLLRAWCLVAYETGMRPSDQLRLRFADLDGCTIRFVQHKTGQPHCVHIRQSTADVLAATCPPSRERIWPFAKWALRRWELLLRLAGAPWRRGCGLGHLRHTHATLIAEAFGLEKAAESLGHVSGVEIARRHYVAHTDATGTLPPELGGADK